MTKTKEIKKLMKEIEELLEDPNTFGEWVAGQKGDGAYNGFICPIDRFINDNISDHRYLIIDVDWGGIQVINHDHYVEGVVSLPEWTKRFLKILNYVTGEVIITEEGKWGEASYNMLLSMLRVSM